MRHVMPFVCTVSQVDANPDAIFALLANPAKHEDIFEAIEGARCSLVEENGPRRK